MKKCFKHVSTIACCWNHESGSVPISLLVLFKILKTLVAKDIWKCSTSILQRFLNKELVVNYLKMKFWHEISCEHVCTIVCCWNYSGSVATSILAVFKTLVAARVYGMHLQVPFLKQEVVVLAEKTSFGTCFYNCMLLKLCMESIQKMFLIDFSSI